MKKLQGFLLTTTIVVAVLAGTAVLAGVPAGKEILKIDLLAGEKGPVEFKHAAHVNDYKKADGSPITCKDCHHTAISEKDAKACSSCHVKEGEAQKEHEGEKAPFIAVKKGDKFDRKSVIFHTKCVDGCHEAVKKATGKKITACTTCHT